MQTTTSVVRPVSGHPGKFERLLAKPFGDSTIGWGQVEIRQPGRKGKCMVRVAGKTGFQKYLTDKFGVTFPCGCGEFHVMARNKVTGLGLRHIVTAVNGTTTTNLGQGFGFQSITTAAMRVGTGTGATTDGTTALVAEVATAPSSITFTGSNPTGGTYRINVTATWNAGAISAVTVTEVALKGNLSTVVTSTFSPNGTQLFARVSSTDGELTPFLIDTAFPLVLSYNFNQIFA